MRAMLTPVEDLTNGVKQKVVLFSGGGGMASTLFVADPENNMVILAFTQYIPFMGVPFAEECKALVQKAVVEPG